MEDASDVLSHGNFELHLAQRELRVQGVPVKVGARAFGLLLVLTQRAGAMVGNEELLALVWPGRVVAETNLHVQVAALRRLIGHRRIVNVPGRGYRLATPDKDAAGGVQAFRPHNLPVALTRFVGRAQELAQLQAAAVGTRLLTLTGPGGCGKTRLALEWAARRLDGFTDGVWLIELATLTDPALVAPTALGLFGLAEKPGQTATQTLCDHLASRRALLVLDNAEHLLGACRSLAEALLRSCPQVELLVTSRERLGVAGERAQRIPSLAVPDLGGPLTPHALADIDAVRLFVERVRAQREGFELNDDNAPAVASLCVRLDGIPLAIELAAVRVRWITPAELDERLDACLTLLVGGASAALPRHQTLRALIDWSHDLLTPAEQQLFAALHVFAAGCTLEAAQQVCGQADAPPHAVLHLLSALADKSLLSVEERAGSTRFRMLDTVWQFAGEKLRAVGDEPQRRARHLEAFADFAERAQPGLEGAEQRLWLARVDADLDNLRAALAWVCSTDRTPRHALGALRIASQLLRYWSTRGRAREGLEWIERCMPLVQDAAADDPAAVARAHASAGWLSFHLCDYPRATRHHQQALEGFETLGLASGAAGALNGLAAVALVQGEYVTAQALTEQALAIRQRLGDRLGAAHLQNTLAGLAAARGDFALACETYVAVVDALREFRDDKGLSSVLVNLGVAMVHVSGSAAARSVFEEALDIALRIGDTVGTASARLNLGNAAIDRRDFSTAERHFSSSLATSRAAADDYGSADLLACLARLRVAEGKLRAAAVLHGAADRLRSRIAAPVAAGSRAEHQAGIAALRQSMQDDAAFEACWRQGRTLSLDAALEWARSTDHPQETDPGNHDHPTRTTRIVDS